MSTTHISALFVAVGLAVQVFAVLSVLRSIGILHEIAADIRERWRRVRLNIGRLIPAVAPATRHYDRRTGEVTVTSDSADAFMTRPADLPAPDDFEEVGQRLNAMQAMLNDHAEEFVLRAARHHAEVQSVQSTAEKRADELRAAMRAEAAKQLRERRREGALLVVGGFLQLCGAVVLLFFD